MKFEHDASLFHQKIELMDLSKPKRIGPVTLADFRKYVAALPAHAESKLTMSVDRAQAMVDLMRSLDPPFNDPKWCDETQAIIDAKIAEILAREANERS
jgi:hypothetical protein